ncbi:MAG TPA: outer membrane beta-barrel protein [Vicinamibacterales bacterium]|jgi:opacity protein-like surface antigen
MRSLLTLVLLLATPTIARAEIFAVPFMGIKFGGGTSIFDIEFVSGAKKFTVGGAVMRIDRGILGYEGSFGFVPGYFERDNELWAPGSFAIDLTGSVLFSLPPDVTAGGLRPYFAVGAGLVHLQANDKLHLFQVRRTVPVANLGGGAIGLITNNVGVRFDYRYLRSLQTDDGSLANVGRRISYNRFTVGLLLRL